VPRTSSDLSTTGVLKRLRATPQHFKRAAAGLTDAQLRRQPDKDAWSLTELLAHLRGASDVQGGWIAKILADDTPTIRTVSPRTGMKKVAGDEFAASLQAYTRQRAALVKTLAALEPADWSRTATFTGTKVQVVTVFHLAIGIAAHEHGHFDQISATAARLRS
jgi:hypothetical protein